MLQADRENNSRFQRLINFIGVVFFAATTPILPPVYDIWKHIALQYNQDHLALFFSTEPFMRMMSITVMFVGLACLFVSLMKQAHARISNQCCIWVY